MPWLYWSLKPQHQQWARQWQQEWQHRLCQLENVIIHGDCFIAPEARLFAEPGRPIEIMGDGTFIAADCVLHGPITLGKGVAVNHHTTMDGGRKGISIGDDTRIAAYCHLYAFNHGQSDAIAIRDQRVTSHGIVIGEDVWLGTHVGVVDGVNIGHQAIVGMNSTVTKNVPPKIKVAGSPAVPIGARN